MKKIIIPLFMILIMASSVLGWGASRTISGQQVTINTDGSGTIAYGIEETIPSGVTISNINEGGYYSSSDGKIRWLFFDNINRQVTYFYSGTGTVNGIISGGEPASSKTITGSTQLGGGSCTCTSWIAGNCGAGTCTSTQKQYTRTCPNNCDVITKCEADTACGSTCTDECTPSGSKACSSPTSTSSTFRTCGNYDNDTCLEWSSSILCALDQYCESGECRTTTPTPTSTCDFYQEEKEGNCVVASWVYIVGGIFLLLFLISSMGGSKK